MREKELIYQGLDKLIVPVEDFSTTSPNYFRISKLPSEFNAGVNTIRFKGNPDVFVDGAEVFIEIIASDGDPVYYEVGLDVESKEQNAIINVYINQDVPPGPAKIYFVSTLKQTIDGKLLDSRTVNIRWSTTIYIDSSKPNAEEIIFDKLPTVTVTSSTGSYTNLAYSSSLRVVTNTYNQPSGRMTYLYKNGQGVLVTGSNATQAFSSSVDSATISLSSIYFSNSIPPLNGTLNTVTFTSSLSFPSGSGIAYFKEPITYNLINSNEIYQPTRLDISRFTVQYVQKSSGIAGTTENSYNLVNVKFDNLSPQSGTISKIRSYYRSTGVLEYLFLNETDISSLASEFGFTSNDVTASFTLPTVQRNDRIDFKFEFINPAGVVSKQAVESLNNLFTGGNTYIGGDDNLLTGSLFVAGATNTGVHISGKGSAAMVRSIGYEGFAKAIAGTGQAGFVLYSGSIQPLLNASETYGGVGLELVANSESYFRYATDNGGSLDVRTNRFFFGNNNSYISSSNGSISILSSKFRLTPIGEVTASAILVQKITGAVTQSMIDTNKAILDATNLGRTIWSEDRRTEYIVSHSGTGTSATVDLVDVTFQGLQNEYSYVVSFQTKFQLVSIISGLQDPRTTINCILYAADSGSSTNSATFYDNWGSQIANDQIIHIYDAALGTGVSSATYSEAIAAKIDISSTPQYEGKLLRLLVQANQNHLSSNYITSGSIKNITVTGTRGIGASWGQSLADPTA